METNSKEFDTIRLLQECDAGSKMAVSAIDEVLDRTQGSTLKNLLLDTKQHHAKLGNDIHTELALSRQYQGAKSGRKRNGMGENQYETDIRTK